MAEAAVFVMHPLFRPLARRALCAALLLTQLTACMTWRPVPGALEQQARAEPISQARLVLRSGAELPLRDVTVRADSVIGYAGDARERRAVPVADVASIDHRQLSPVRTAAAVGGTAVVAFVVVLGVAIGQLGGDINAAPAPSVP